MSDDPKPALMSAARLAEIRATFAAHDNGEAECDAQSLADFTRDLLAHLDALTAPVDGEALGRLLFETEVEHVRREHPEAPVAPPTWDGASPMWQRAMSAGAIALDAHGYARGRADGEAERARLAAELAEEQDAHRVASRALFSHAEEIARLTAELAEAREPAALTHADGPTGHPLCGTTSALYVTRQPEAVTCPTCARREGARDERADVDLYLLTAYQRTRYEGPAAEALSDALDWVRARSDAVPVEGEDGAT